ncbi:MAG: CRTAC1 family protein [Ardenticatenales bacterium]|nr:CRTAC1 family protein [Ardenticatenales bacterium]
MKRLPRLAALLAAVVLASCKPGDSGSTLPDAHGTAPAAAAAPAEHGHGAEALPGLAAAEHPQHPGTVLMAARLAQIVAGLTLESATYESSIRLKALQSAPPPADPQQAFTRAFNIGVEQLGAGQFEAAIQTFEALRSHLRQQSQSMTDSEALRTLTSMIGVTWLRWGEVRNCAVNHNADSCLLPIQGGGVHQDTEGVDHAIPEFEVLLRVDPDDLTSLWLLNVAHMARGTWPDGVAEKFRLDPSLFASSADIGRFMDIAPGLGVDASGLAGGVIMDDFTGDGNLDILNSSWGVSDPLYFFVSNGDGTFEDRTAAAGLTGLTGGLNIGQVDYDGDGWLDFFIYRGAWRLGSTTFPSSLVRNMGDGTFEDVTEAAGLLSYHPTQAGAWADFDADGDLDLFCGNENADGGTTHPNQLWRNNGDGTFTDIARASGVELPGYTKGAAWGDFDNDGRPDLFLSRMGQDEVLWHNDGPGADGAWRFSDVTAAAGVRGPRNSFSTWWWDYDNDGWLDLIVAPFGQQGADVRPAADTLAGLLGRPTNASRLALYRNNGDGTFEDVAPEAGVDGVFYAMGTNFGDLNNDGSEDFYLGTGNPDYRALVPNKMFLNAGDGTFDDITTSGGFGNLQKGHAVSFADLDNDGDQDVYADLGGAYEGDWYPNSLFENPGHGKRWVTLRLKGDRANGFAVGARVRVRLATPAGPRTLHRLVGTGSSFGANSLQIELGLGDATAIEAVDVTWPGTVEPETFSGVGMDAIWQLRHDTGVASPVAQAPFGLGGGAGAGRPAAP